MESIILLALFGIISSVIQSAVKNSKKQQQLNKEALGVKPKVQPINETLNKPYMKMEPEIVQEETRYDAYENLVMLDQEAVSTSTSSLILMEDINFDELQRSIVMAEVLGKPKALRKGIR